VVKAVIRQFRPSGYNKSALFYWLPSVYPWVGANIKRGYEMSEAELAEQASNYGGQGIAIFTVWVSVLAGCLVTAYMAGRNLERDQVVLLNSMYLFVCALVIFAIFASFKVQAFYSEQLRENFPWSPQVSTIYIAIGITVATTCAMFASLKFMWDIRHPKTE
jgi:hypothetical protein